MEKFSYKTFDPDSTELVYDASKGYTEPSSELDTRKELSYPLKELKDFIGFVTPVKNDDALQLVVDEQNVINYRTTPDGTLHEIYATGPAGPAGQGVPTGGTSGQVLSKASGTDYDTTWANVNADTLDGYTVNTLMKAFFPVGSVIQNTTNTNPSTYITGTTWVLMSSVILASEHVFGNGYSFGITDGTHIRSLRSQDGNRVCALNGDFGNLIGEAGFTNDLTVDKSTGVPTKSQLGSNPEKSGLIADTITVYTWERTA